MGSFSRSIKNLQASAVLALWVLTQLSSWATPTENNGLRILPAPSQVVIDGKTDDWDLSAGIFACDNVENQRDQYAVWLHAMYDQANLYILARFTDLTPLNNPGQTIADYGFAGDCLQFRMIEASETPNERTSHWTCWRGKDGRDIVTAQYGKVIDDKGTIQDAKTRGVQQAFSINPDGKGYVQELAIPWKLLTKDGTAPNPGESIRLTFEPNFTVGQKGRVTLKDLFQPGIRPDRVFTFMNWSVWGKATLEAKPGPVPPQSVRLADGRQFPVQIKSGVPVVDWTGLVKDMELPGFKVIHFTMPDDGYISLNIKAADGTVARQLLNAAFYTKGPHEVKWDGLTNLDAHLPGRPVSAGSYRWSGLFHKQIGLKLRGWAANSGSVPWDNGDATNWGGDEGNPVAAATDETQVYLGWMEAEAGSAILACDLEGNVKWKNKHGGIAGVKALAASDGIVYVLIGGEEMGTSLFKLNAKDGNYIAWSGDIGVDLAVKSLWSGGAGGPEAADAMAAHNGKLYLSFTGANKVLVLDGGSGKVVQTWDVAAPGSLQVGRDGSAYGVSGGTSVVRIDASGKSTPLISGLSNAAALALDQAGLIYVGVGDPDNQVKVFDGTGKALETIGRQGGRALLRKWTSDGMRFIAGAAVAADGKLWVAECDSFPRRFSVWDTKTAGFTKEFFGSTDYGATGGAIDPLDPNVMAGLGCEWRIDPATGRAACVSVITRDGMGNSRFAVGSNGRLYLAVITGGTYDGSTPINIYERIGEGEYKLRGKFFHDQPDTAKEPTSTSYWADANGDGQVQPEEVTTVPGNMSLNRWYLSMAPDLTFYCDSQQFKVTNFTAAGAPVYDLKNPVQMPGSNPNSSMGSADDRLVIYNGVYQADRSTFDVYDIASGKLIWSYPNNFVGVHGSHNATPAEVGMIRGAFDIAGTARLPDPIGNIWVIPTNVGEWHILTGDGFYLTRLFQGDAFKIQWPKDAVPGADMTDAPCGTGGEDFGGSIAEGNDGKLYIQAGKTGFWNLEVTGLDTVRAMPGEKIDMSDADIVQAGTMRESEMQMVVGKHTLAIKKATPVFTGDLAADFKGSDLISFEKTDETAVKAAATWDDANLYLAWDVSDGTPWQNSAKVPEDMYVGGDTVDFQMRTDPIDKKSDEPIQGDLRLSIGNFQNKATAVLYRKVSGMKKPKIFSSGVVHSYSMDFVDVLADAKITVKTRTDGYVVEAIIPLGDLGFKPAPGLNLTGDFGATFGLAGGGRTRLRSYWNNQHTGLVDDAVFELEMEPQKWGELHFVP